MSDFSEYIVYVDESGDHGLASIDPYYPVFVLAFCIFRKADLSSTIAPALTDFKFRHFGHDMVVLHERDIRKDTGDFLFLKTRAKKEAFLSELTDLVAQAPFALISTVIKKDSLKARYAHPDNPYHIALGFGLERVYRFLQNQEAVQHLTHVVVERRGKKEDDELELEFRRVCDGSNMGAYQLPFQIVFSHKQSNSCGLQLADLIARPIGLATLHPQQPNRAFDILKGKFDRSSTGKIEGWGLKVFP